MLNYAVSVKVNDDFVVIATVASLYNQVPGGIIPAVAFSLRL